MSRYDNTLKYVQLRNLIEDKKYEEALEKAKQLELKKIKDISELKIIADVYKKCGEYRRAKELYYTVYSEQKIRRNLYNLIMLCLMDKCYDEAESLYEEYNTIDKNSIYRYILRYRIDKSKDSDISVIINDLETIKREYYMEDWGYELAKQYHKAGMTDKCIEECDDIILWFSEGEIVERARLLRMHYEGGVTGDIENVQSALAGDVSAYIDDDDDLYREQTDVRPAAVQKDEDADVSEDVYEQQEVTVHEEEYEDARQEVSVHEGEQQQMSLVQDVSEAAAEDSTELQMEAQMSEEATMPDDSVAEDDMPVNESGSGITSKKRKRLYNTDKNKVLNNALSEAAVLKNAVAKEAEDIDMDGVKIGYGEEDEFAEQLESELADNIAVELEADNRELEESVEQTAEQTAEQYEVSEESIEDMVIPSEPIEGLELSKYGYKIDYIMEKELYDRLQKRVTVPANFAVSLLEHENATEIVKSIAKKIGESGHISKPKIAKISADKLNTINLEEYIEDLLGTCIMIENASNMSSQTVNRIIRVIDAHPSELVIILVDKEEPLSRFLLKEAVLSNQLNYYVVY